MFFEVGLAREAARTATLEDLASLREALEANRLGIGDRSRFTSTDIAFHFELARIARNLIFVAPHDQISEWLKEQRIVTLAADGQEQTADEAHRAIYDGIVARSRSCRTGDARASRSADDDVLAPAGKRP